MPYRIVALRGGFALQDTNSRKLVSSRPITRAEALNQLEKFNSSEKTGAYRPSKKALPPLINEVGMPSWVEPNTAERFAQAAYSSTPPKKIGSYILVSSSPTLKFYSYGKTVIICVRGTADARDIQSWPLVATSRVSSGARYAHDLSVIQSFKASRGHTDFTYYAVGHSLGGAIIDSLLRAGIVKAGISFNPAVQLNDLKAGLHNWRVYNAQDPLYLLMGQFADGTHVVGGSSVLQRLVGVIPFYGQLVEAYSKLKAHQIESFL